MTSGGAVLVGLADSALLQSIAMFDVAKEHPHPGAGRLSAGPGWPFRGDLKGCGCAE